MPVEPTKPFLARVSDALPDLHPSERKLANLVLDFPGEMAGYTATEIAGLASVSNATVSRFVRRIGYASFEEARRAVRDEQRAGTALLRFSSNMPTGGAVARHFETSQQNLELTYGALDETDVDALARSMIAAPRVWFIGFRAGQTFARYLGWQTSQVLPNVTVLPRAGETLAESLVSLTDEHVVMLIALRRSPRIVDTVAATVRKAKAQLAVLQDGPVAEHLHADWHLSCVTSTSAPLMNHVGCMAVCNLVGARTIELAGAAGRSRMAAIEESHRRFDEL